MIARIASCCLVVAGLIGLASWLVVSESSSNIAFADVQKKMKEARTVTFTLIIEQTEPDPQPEDVQYKYMYMGDHLVRSEFVMKGKTVFAVIENTKEGKGLALNPKNQTAYFYEKDRKTDPDQKQKSNYENIMHIVKNQKDAKKLTEKLIDGKKTVGFQVQLPNIGEKGEFQRVWVDSRTRLPVFIEFFGKDDAGQETLLRTMTEIVFGGKLDPKQFHLELPADYRIETKDDVIKLGSTTDNRTAEVPLQISFADVQKKMQEARTVTLTVTQQNLGPEDSSLQVGDVVVKYMLSGDRARIESHVKGKIMNVMVIDQKAGKMLMLGPLNKTAYIIDQIEDKIDTGNLSAYEYFRTYHLSKKKIKNLPEKIIDGKKYPGFEFKLVKDDKDHNWYGRVWVDPETKFPVYQEDYQKDESGQLILNQITSDIVFGKELDPKLFDLTPPGDYVQKKQKGFSPFPIDPPM